MQALSQLSYSPTEQAREGTGRLWNLSTCATVCGGCPQSADGVADDVRQGAFRASRIVGTNGKVVGSGGEIFDDIGRNTDAWDVDNLIQHVRDRAVVDSISGKICQWSAVGVLIRRHPGQSGLPHTALIRSARGGTVLRRCRLRQGCTAASAPCENGADGDQCQTALESAQARQLLHVFPLLETPTPRQNCAARLRV